MKLRILLLAVFCALCVAVAKAEEDLYAELFDELPEIDIEDLERELELVKQLQKEEKAKQRDSLREDKLAQDLAKKIGENYNHYNEEAFDPCHGFPCGAGKVCILENNLAKCICIQECPEESDSRRRVCTNRNETWSSDCEVYRQHCLCNENDAGCKNAEFKHIHIDYYGECKILPPCTEEEKSDFPRRMRDWLFTIMRDLAERHELEVNFLALEQEAETNMTRRWANAAIWKWCDLDGEPNDRSVSRHELFPIRAPLLSLEHCIAPFFESCDANKDHRITLKEWGQCLEINEEDMIDRCDEISEKNLHFATG